jgi:type IV pilus assembly protein PilV
MIEVLVSLVVLSVGLLGLAGLQTTQLQVNQSAYYRSQITILASDLMDRMRANKQGVANGAYDSLIDGSNDDLEDPDCLTNGCTANQMAQQDAYDWNQQIATLLPGGNAVVTRSGSTTVFTITVMWDDDKSGATGTDCSGDPSVDLSCFVMQSQL